MKYIDKKQVNNYLFKSSLVFFNSKTYNVGFVGVELERCELKLPEHIFRNTLTVCMLLDIEHYVI